VINVPAPAGATGTAPAEVQPGTRPGWRLLDVSIGDLPCEECGRPMTTLYLVADPDGRKLLVGRGCLNKLARWQLREVDEVRHLEIAERDRRWAVGWATFRREFPADAAMIERDIAAHERLAVTAGGCRSHEIRDQISELFGSHREWALTAVRRYRERRAQLWWVSHA
jgi:hypothetical protein